MNSPENFLNNLPFPAVGVTGEKAEAELLKRRELRADTTPVIVGDRESVERLIELWDEPFDGKRESELALELSPEKWFARRREDGDEYTLDDSQSEVHESGAAPMTRLAIGYDYRGVARPEVLIATLPTDDAALIPILLRFGAWNACPEAHEHAAPARYWRGKFGAEIATLSSDVIDLVASEPSHSDARSDQASTRRANASRVPWTRSLSVP